MAPAHCHIPRHPSPRLSSDSFPENNTGDEDESSSGSRPPKLAPAEGGGTKEGRGAEVGQPGDLEAHAGRTPFFP